jgi:hypothetical protein
MTGLNNVNSKNIQAIDSGTGSDKLLSTSITSFNFDGRLLANIEYRQIKDITVGSIVFLQSPATSSNPVSYKISKIIQDPDTLLYDVSYFSNSNLYETFIQRSPLRNISANIVSGVATVTVPSTAGMFVGVSLEKVDGGGVFGADYPVIQSIDSSTQITLTVNHNTSGSVVFNVMENRGKYVGTEQFHVQVQTVDRNALGTEGWALTSGGQSIFTDIYARGHIEASSGFISGRLEVGTDNAESSYMTIGTDIFLGDPFENVAKQHNGIFINPNNYLLTYSPLNDKTITSVVVTNPNQNRTKKIITLDVLSHDFVLGTTSDGSVDTTEYFVLSGLTDILSELNGTQRVTALTPTSVTFYVYSETAFNSTYTSLSGSIQKFGNYDPYSCSSLSISSAADPITYNLARFYTSGNILQVGELIDIDGLTGALLQLNSSFQIVSSTSTYVEVRDYGTLITPNTYAQTGTFSTLNNETKFKIGSSTNFMRYDSSTDILSVTGTIKATSGEFTGDLEVKTGGRMFAGSLTSGTRVEITSAGLFGYGPLSTSIPVFKIPTDGSDPEVGKFKVIQTGLSSETGNLIAGNQQYNITLYGATNAPTLYSTLGGTATTYAGTMPGFVIDTSSNKTRMRLSGGPGNGELNFNGTDLSMTGAINATSGNFISTVTIGKAATQGKLQVGTGTNYFEVIGTNEPTTTVIKTKSASFGTSGVWLDAVGNFSLGTALNYNATTNVLTISGSSSGIQPGNGISVNASNQITSISGTNGITISSGLTTGARVQLDQNGLKAYNSVGTNTVAINSDGSASFTGAIVATSGSFNDLTATGKLTANVSTEIGNNLRGAANYSGIVISNLNWHNAWLRRNDGSIYFKAGSETGSAPYIQMDTSGTSAIVFPNFSVNSAGTVSVAGSINASSGSFSGYVTTSSGARFGTNVSSTNDGLWLNANNYFLFNGTAATFRVGNSTNYLAMNSTDTNTRLQIDTANSSYAVEVGGSVRATTFIGALSGTASNAALLDSIDSASFLRSDAADTWAGSTLSFLPTGAAQYLVFDGGLNDTSNDPILTATGTAHTFGRIGRPGNRMYAGYFSLLYSGTTSITSDIREKTNVKNSDLGLNFINMLRPVKYKMINGIKKEFDAEGNIIENLPGTRWHYGLIAQELKEVLDSYSLDSAMWSIEDFETNPDGKQAINYNQVVSPLIKAVQELSEMVINLQNRLAALES